MDSDCKSLLNRMPKIQMWLGMLLFAFNPSTGEAAWSTFTVRLA